MQENLGSLSSQSLECYSSSEWLWTNSAALCLSFLQRDLRDGSTQTACAISFRLQHYGMQSSNVRLRDIRRLRPNGLKTDSRSTVRSIGMAMYVNRRTLFSLPLKIHRNSLATGSSVPHVYIYVSYVK